METLSSTISETRSGFDLKNDLDLIDGINQKLKTLDSIRQSDLESHRKANTNLSKKIESLESLVQELKSSGKLQDIIKDSVQLENELFAIANNLSSLNLDLNTLKLTYNQDLKKLEELESQLHSLKIDHSSKIPQNNQGDDTSVNHDTAKILKLKLFESLGLKLDFEKRQVLVLNKLQNNSNVLNMDDNYSEYFVSNYIWDNL